uniref:Uncharacterized protein n=2 Tax=Avena sativa TaxID=4498 RepID=A0ACD5XPL7_AVESA
MGAETDLSPPPLEPTASPEPEILRNRNDDRDWKADMISALGESVSFGRFLSEPLDWGKWSAFEHKRYLEEAAGQSRPGSVAQKKAFFEEHYARKRKSQDDADADADEDVEGGGAACWSAGSSCMTDEPAGEATRGVDSSPDRGVIVDAAPVDAASEEPKAVPNAVGLPCSLDNTNEPSHKHDDVQVAEARNGLQLDEGCIVATVEPVEKQPLQESSIVNQGTTDSVKKRRLPIALLFQKPTEFSSPPSGKKTPSQSVKRRSTLRSAKENSSPSPSTDSNKQEGASVAQKRSTFGTLHMSMNFRRCETGNPASSSRNLGSTIASRISQLESASRPMKHTPPKVNQFRQTKKGFFKGMPEMASKTSQQHEQRSSHVRVKEMVFSSTSSPAHPKTNLAKENMVNANNESELKELCPSIRFKARTLPNFHWKNKEPKDKSQQSAQEIPDLPNNNHQLNDASNPHVVSRGAPKDKQRCCFSLRRLC